MLIEKELGNMNSPTSINEMGLAVKILPKRKLQDQMAFLRVSVNATINNTHFTQSFQIIQEESIFPMSLYEEGMSLMPKTIQTNKQKPESRDITKKVNYRPELHIKPDTKILRQNFRKSLNI